MLKYYDKNKAKSETILLVECDCAGCNYYDDP